MNGPFVFEVLIAGTQSMLDRVREITALPEPGGRGAFSFDRIIPRPICIEGTIDRRAEFAERFHAEVVPAWERLLGDYTEADADFHRYRMTELLDPACGLIWKMGFASDTSPTLWMRENWGSWANVAPRESQERGSTAHWIGNRIHARLTMDSSNTDPPLLVFDALASMVPGVTIALAWSSEDMHVTGESTGLATWRNGLRIGQSESKFHDREERFGALRSLRPLRVARRISRAGFVESSCHPTLRWDLTAAALEALRDGETITIPIGPAHEATVGSERGVDFLVTTEAQVTPAVIYDNHGAIPDDEVWHRLPGRIDGMDVALSLHSPEVVEDNQWGLMVTAGMDTRQEWIKREWSW